MKRNNRKTFRVCAVYDTETCNYGEGSETRAYPILYIINDIRNIDLRTYDINNNCDDIRFYRHDTEIYDYISDLIEYGISNDFVPIVCAYNLMFDLQPLMFDLNETYHMRTTAQTATSAYTVDLLDDSGEPILRFWDTFYLEMNGLKAMGETCGLPKAVGDWNYDLIRTPETPLTEKELYYAGRDTQVIPAYLRYLLQANEWLKPEMFGHTVLTKTSLVRQMAKHDIGRLTYVNGKGNKIKLGFAFEKLCFQEQAKTFDIYALRKACFRGGLTFTSANYASQVQKNVASLDVTSMHHTFINGRYIPVHFNKTIPILLKKICNTIVKTNLATVLNNYHKPFHYAIHAKIRFRNLRIKPNTVFSTCGIGIIPESKFTNKISAYEDFSGNLRGVYAEENIRLNGWKDKALKPVFAYGKLMECAECDLHLNEIELWNIAQAYSWDSMYVILGESTARFVRPPDYVSLQSNMLFERKQDMKTILKYYKQGEKYGFEVPNSIPAGLKTEIENGTADVKFLEAYYQSTVKGQFNSIYGAMAMDVVKPDFEIETGEIMIDKSTMVTPENYAERLPKSNRVLYTYGMRIVAGSRQHLVIALMLLHDYFGGNVKPTGGDTDSIKCACAENITDEMLAESLEPLAVASDKAINKSQERIRKCYPNYASTLDSIGHFDIENAIDGTRWDNHLEAWNKARISEQRGEYHVTCAGLSRPRGMYHIEKLCNDLAKSGYTFAQIAPNVLGYNVLVRHEICHMLQKKRPETSTVFNETVTDYLGNTTRVFVHESIALYPQSRWLGESCKRASAENLQWLKVHKIRVEEKERIISADENHAIISVMDKNGEMKPLLKGVRNE